MQLTPVSNHTGLFPHPQTNRASQEVTVLPGGSAGLGLVWHRLPLHRSYDLDLPGWCRDGAWVLLMLEQKPESNPEISGI